MATYLVLAILLILNRLGLSDLVGLEHELDLSNLVGLVTDTIRDPEWCGLVPSREDVDLGWDLLVDLVGLVQIQIWVDLVARTIL